MCVLAPSGLCQLETFIHRDRIGCKQIEKLGGNTILHEQLYEIQEKQSYMYAIEVELINSLNDSSGASVPLNPGMIAQVDIIRGQQTVLEYFWQPIAKLKDDAFRQ